MTMPTIPPTGSSAAFDVEVHNKAVKSLSAISETATCAEAKDMVRNT